MLHRKYSNGCTSRADNDKKTCSDDKLLSLKDIKSIPVKNCTKEQANRYQRLMYKKRKKTVSAAKFEHSTEQRK